MYIQFYYLYIMLIETAMKTLKEQIESLSASACENAIKWAGSRTLDQAWNECHRGDHLLWLYRRSSSYDFQKLILAKGHCANTVRHLMRDERSKKAVDVAIAFGEGNASYDDLNAAAADAADAAAAAADAADAATDHASAADAAAAAYAATAAYAIYTDAAGAVAAYAAAGADVDAVRKKAKEENQKLTADICRKYLPIPLFGF
jgi:hypothetical protein